MVRCGAVRATTNEGSTKPTLTEDWPFIPVTQSPRICHVTQQFVAAFWAASWPISGSLSGRLPSTSSRVTRVVRAQSFGSASRCRREVGPGASRRLASRRGASPQARALPPLTHSRDPCSSYRGARRACARVRARA